MASQNSLNIGCLIYTHERVDDAKINQEIIRSLWTNSGLFGKIPIVHAYNGSRSWYPKQYLEDALIRRTNPGHFQGAAELLDAGVAMFVRRFPKIRYIVIMAADTWCLKPSYIASTIRTMVKNNQVLATCPWGLPERYRETGVGIATDFFVLDVQWAAKYRFFPLRYREFWLKYHDFISYLRPGGNVSVERLALARFHDASFAQYRDNVRRKALAERQVLILRDRMPVHTKKDKQGYWVRRFFWPKIGLVTHHQPLPKQVIVRRTKGISGRSIVQLRKAKDLNYYNHGRTKRLSYN